MKQEETRGDHLPSVGSPGSRPAMAARFSPNSVTQQPSPFPTPSPFSVPPSTRWSSAGPPIHLSVLVLRFLALLFSFISAVALASPSATKAHDHHHLHQNLPLNSELVYCLIVSVLVFVYSALQLFKGVCDMVHSGMLISDKVSDYMNFLLDQLAVYLVISCLSVGVIGTKRMEAWSTSQWSKAVISVSMSAATFIVIAACGLLSGYKLCKRIIW
ncbi:unnamed protein product [Linum trigynum]|uniref:CASP-like protein n=1 Tax=Linum trigynum TaxID=586398 RepID=A0AAV2DN57_9ROSI